MELKEGAGLWVRSVVDMNLVHELNDRVSRRLARRREVLASATTTRHTDARHGVAHFHKL